LPISLIFGFSPGGTCRHVVLRKIGDQLGIVQHRHEGGVAVLASVEIAIVGKEIVVEFVIVGHRPSPIVFGPKLSNICEPTITESG
jgi:hypothetical protein